MQKGILSLACALNGAPAHWLTISHRRLAFNPVKKEAFKEGINPDGSPHSEWKAKYYLVRTQSGPKPLLLDSHPVSA